MIRRIATWLAGHGVTDLVMNLHHAPETLTAVVGDGSDLGVRVRYSWEQPLLGSAGGPRLALPLLETYKSEVGSLKSEGDVKSERNQTSDFTLNTYGEDAFLIVNGDTLTDVDVSALAAAHEASGALVTLALVPNREFNRYGGVSVDEEARVTGFTKRGPAAEGSWHFIGVQLVRASVFEGLQPGVAASTIGGLYDDLIRTRLGSVRAFRSEAAFWDVGTPADYLMTSNAFSTTGVDAGRRVHIDPTARVTRSILWDDVDVEARAELDGCIVTDGVRVPAGASYRQMILMQDGDTLAAVPIAPPSLGPIGTSLGEAGSHLRSGQL